MPTPLVTSGEDGFTLPAFKLITSALRICGVIAEEETPTAGMAQDSLEALNAMVTGWEATGIHVWGEEEAMIFLQPKQTQYQLGTGSPDRACLFENFTQATLTATGEPGAGSVQVSSIAGLSAGDTFGVQLDNGTNFFTMIASAPTGTTVPLVAALPSQATSGALAFDYTVPLQRPLRAPAARRYQYRSRIQTPLIVLSRLDYDYLPNQFAGGAVTQFFYDPQTGNGSYKAGAALGLMNLWPTPSDNTYALRFVSQRPIQFFANLANVPDFPSEWTAALKWNLALEVAPEFDVAPQRMAMIEKKAQEWFLRCSAWDKEPEPVLFGMAMYPGLR